MKNLKNLKIWKIWKFEKSENLKNLEIWKIWKFEKSKILKNLNIWKIWQFKKYINLKNLKPHSPKPSNFGHWWPPTDWLCWTRGLKNCDLEYKTMLITMVSSDFGSNIIFWWFCPKNMFFSHLDKKSQIPENHPFTSEIWKKSWSYRQKNWSLMFSWVLITKNAIKRSAVLRERLKSQFPRFSHSQFWDFSKLRVHRFWRGLTKSTPTEVCSRRTKNIFCKNVPMCAPSDMGSIKTRFRTVLTQL